MCPLEMEALMRKMILLLLLVFAVQTAQADSIPEKPVYYGGSEMEAPADALFLEDGSVLVVGSTRSTNGAFEGYMEEDHNNYAYATMFGPDGAVRWQLVHSRDYGDNAFECILPQADGTYVLPFRYGFYKDQKSGLALVQVSPEGQIMHETEVPVDKYWGCEPAGENLVIRRVGGINYLPEWNWAAENVASLECVTGDGIVLWRHTYPELKALQWEFSVTPVEDGYYLAGARDVRIDEHYMSSRGWVARLDTDGNLLWYREIETGTASLCAKVLPTGGGGLIVAGGYADDRETLNMAGMAQWMGDDGSMGHLQTYPVGRYQMFTDILPVGDDEGFLLMTSSAYCDNLSMVWIDLGGHIFYKWNQKTPAEEPMQAARLYRAGDWFAVAAMAHVDIEANPNNGDILLMPVSKP